MRDPFNFSHDHVSLFDFLLDFCSFPFQVFKLGDDAVCLFVYCYERMSVCVCVVTNIDIFNLPVII